MSIPWVLKLLPIKLYQFSFELYFRVAFSENETPPPSPVNFPNFRVEVDSPICWADREMLNLQRGRVESKNLSKYFYQKRILWGLVDRG